MKFTRRNCLQALALPLIVGTPGLTRSGDATDDLTRYVNLFVGTGGHGHTFPSATVPFGAVQLGPDTNNRGWDWCSGYHDTDKSLMGFSHTHLSGTGIGDMLDILVMPHVGTPVPQGYRARFSHRDEHAEPGYYQVRLPDTKITAELTATERTGLHRYVFPQSNQAHFIVDLAHGYAGSEKGPARIFEVDLHQVNATTIAGGRRVNEWAKGRHIYFVMEFSRPFDRVVFHGPRAMLHYQTSEGEAIQIKTGISGVSIEGALRNLQAESPGWDFEATRTRAKEAWQKQLSKIQIETSNRNEKTIFYSALYHTMLAPTLFDDVDEQYRGMDGQVHRVPTEAHNYSTFSLWDTYRALHPLFTLMHPERVPDLVNCLIRMAKESPEGAPVWPLQGVETGCMSGYHSAPVIAEAIAKGFPGIDIQGAYECLQKRAMQDDYRGLGLYRKLGYIPCDQVEEAASKTLEYAYDDWAVASVALAAGHKDEAKELKERSYSYRNLFDKNTQFMRPRLANGHWAEPFDPRALGHFAKWQDFTECNAWQATFLVQHDPAPYFALFGGPEKFVERLDALFNQSSELPPGSPPDIAGMVGQYAHGNEPSHHVAYLYALAGAPEKTQRRVRYLLEKMYSNNPDGMAGNEDCGQMSAWYVMSALGFYAVDPVSANYALGTPLFEKASVHIGGGKTLTLEAQRKSPAEAIVKSVSFNGKPHRECWFSHASIAHGGSFVFEMTA